MCKWHVTVPTVPTQEAILEEGGKNRNLIVVMHPVVVADLLSLPDRLLGHNNHVPVLVKPNKVKSTLYYRRFLL